MEFVEDGFKFFTICCKLKTTNLKLKKGAVLMRQPLFCSQRLAVSRSQKYTANGHVRRGRLSKAARCEFLSQPIRV